MIGLILTGGRSRRMGRDKLLIERPDGQRQIDWLAQLVREAGLEPMLSQRRGARPVIGLPVIEDHFADAGPLSALDAFHRRYPQEPVLLLGGDLFLMNRVTLEDLLAARSPRNAATCYANRLDDKPEPLCTIFESRALLPLADRLEQHEYGARHFLAGLDPHKLRLRHPAALDNVNSPLDLEEAFSKLRAGVSPKTIHLCGIPGERSYVSLATTTGGLLAELAFIHRWKGPWESLEIIRNGELLSPGALIRSGDQILIQGELSGSP
ncbi:NTP transferase domain-containing protein [Luteolibacter sp. GHJ8]|uniref:NTP transferase domain-containing protein n=1 Tax=Luteolibacter rhizosphaerae TaxID=2989719 RepID=A0ABT3G7F9_9BACT|nr:NTP transferase domain-containing protein [Luteolibacter rhizosphaerae]MCW1915421.1 NTP transferase domain-containing protein [Luteolibacter rhizosphaerae]